jgi:hypothetical protein
MQARGCKNTLDKTQVSLGFTLVMSATSFSVWVTLCMPFPELVGSAQTEETRDQWESGWAGGMGRGHVDSIGLQGYVFSGYTWYCQDLDVPCQGGRFAAAVWSYIKATVPAKSPVASC